MKNNRVTIKMSIKQDVLNILNKNVGKTISGGELAKMLGVTRNTVWKAINSLKNEGYDISSHSNTGYTLNNKVDIFNECSIKNYLKEPHKIIIYDSASSSNTLAKEMCQNGENEGTVVIVKSQTNGKGRMGRTFISSSENGLYMTIILRPNIPASESLYITVLGAVALCEAIYNTSGTRADIKWVNDIYINNKKCAGILTEAQLNIENGMLDYAVIGMGINIAPPKDGFDAQISDIATSIYKNEAPCGYKSRLCAEIIERFFYYYNQIENKDSYMPKYIEKSNILGKEVDMYVGEKITSGKAIAIDENANLIVETKNGMLSFSSGEARVREKGTRL